MLACGPGAAVLFRVALILQEARVARAAPGLQQFAGLIELKNGRRGHAAAVQLAVRTRETEVADRASASVLRSGTLHSTVGGANGTRTVIDPDMIVLIDSDTTDVTNDPMMRQRLRPRRIEHKGGRSSFGSFVLGHALQNFGPLQRFDSSLLRAQCGCETRDTEYPGKHCGKNRKIDTF